VVHFPQVAWPSVTFENLLHGWTQSCLDAGRIYFFYQPFGGYKQSGWGLEKGRDVFELYTQTKAVCLKM
jgi:hypothetical protein